MVASQPYLDKMKMSLDTNRQHNRQVITQWNTLGRKLFFKIREINCILYYTMFGREPFRNETSYILKVLVIISISYPRRIGGFVNIIKFMLVHSRNSDLTIGLMMMCYYNRSSTNTRSNCKSKQQQCYVTMCVVTILKVKDFLDSKMKFPVWTIKIFMDYQYCGGNQ